MPALSRSIGSGGTAPTVSDAGTTLLSVAVAVARLVPRGGAATVDVAAGTSAATAVPVAAPCSAGSVRYYHCDTTLEKI